MYAIVEIAGQQFLVEKKDEIFVHRLEGEAGSKVEFDEVLLLDDKGKVNVGTPHVEGSKVSCKIIDHVRAIKLSSSRKRKEKVFRKKPATVRILPKYSSRISV